METVFSFKHNETDSSVKLDKAQSTKFIFTNHNDSAIHVASNPEDLFLVEQPETDFHIPEGFLEELYYLLHQLETGISGINHQYNTFKTLWDSEGMRGMLLHYDDLTLAEMDERALAWLGFTRQKEVDAYEQSHQ